MLDWTSFLYGYGVGGLLFATPILLAWKKGALRLDRPEGKRLLAGLLVTYLAYFTVHGLWTYLALGSR